MVASALREESAGLFLSEDVHLGWFAQGESAGQGARHHHLRLARGGDVRAYRFWVDVVKDEQAAVAIGFQAVPDLSADGLQVCTGLVDAQAISDHSEAAEDGRRVFGVDPGDHAPA